MAEKIFIADKPTLDDVNVKTTDIQNKVTQLANTESKVVKSVQRGSVVISETQKNISVAISSIDVSKSFLILSNHANSNYGNYGDFFVSGNIVNETTLQFRHKNTLNSAFIEWQVVEFY